MPAPQNPERKAILLKHDDILEMDNQRYWKVCLNNRQIAVLKALLQTAYWRTRWDNLTWTKDELEAWVAEIDYRLDSQEECMGCTDCYVNINTLIIEITTHYETYNTWYTAFVASGSVSIATQVSNDIEKGQGHDAATQHLWCYMTELYINALCDGLIQRRASENKDHMETIADVLEAVAGAFGIVAVLAPAAAVTAFAAAALAAVLSSAIARVLPANIGDEILAALQDQDARNEVICCMYSRLALSGTIITNASWISQVLDDTSGGSYCDSDNFSDNGNILRAFLRPLVATTEQYVSFFRTLSDFNWLAAEGAGAIPACACDDWCYLFDFAIDNGGWSLLFDTDQHGVYDAGVGWQAVDASGEMALYIGITSAAAATVSRVDVYVTMNVSDCEYPHTDQIWLGVDDFDWPSADTYRLVRTNVDCPCGVETFTYTAIPSSPVQANWWGAIVTRYANAPNIWITGVKYSGKGANPFGADNC